MDIQALKQKIINGQVSDEELSNLLVNATNNTHSRRKGSFFKDILRGFSEVYTTPNIWRSTMESILILVIIVGIVILSYNGRIDATITSIFLASVLGFLFGKIK